MTVYDSGKRWDLIQVSTKDECFIVIDNLAKKKRVYHVPQLLHAELVNSAVYVYTSSSKIMQLDLLTATRQFLSAVQLKKIIQANDAIQIKKAAAKKPQQAFENVVRMVNTSFFNTVNSY